MAADLEEKTNRYGELLAEALEAATIAPPEGTPMAEAAADCYEMASSYLEDGTHFRERGDLVNALASFSYGHCGSMRGPHRIVRCADGGPPLHRRVAEFTRRVETVSRPCYPTRLITM